MSMIKGSLTLKIYLVSYIAHNIQYREWGVRLSPTFHSIKQYSVRSQENKNQGTIVPQFIDSTALLLEDTYVNRANTKKILPKLV